MEDVGFFLNTKAHQNTNPSMILLKVFQLVMPERDKIIGFFDVVEKRLKEVDGIVEFSKIEMGLRGTKRIVPFFRTSGGRANIAPELALLQSRVQIQYVETVGYCL